MADQKIIDLPPLAIQALTDLYEVSANGALSSRESRLQMLSFMTANIAGAPYTVGDIIYADSATTLNKIPGTAVGDVLLSDGVGAAPKYGLVNLTTSVANVLPVVNGGTGDSSYIDGELLIGNSTGNTLAKSTLTSGTGISIANGPGAVTISATGDQNIEYQDVYDNTVATSFDANTDMSNGFPITFSSTTEVARPFSEMTVVQSNALVSPINGGQLWNQDANRIRSNRGSDVTPILDDVAYLTDIPVIVNDGSYAEMSFQGNATETVIVTQGVPVKIAGTYVAGPLADFTHLDGVLTYVGVATKAFEISFVISAKCELSAIDASSIITLNGGVIAKSKQSDFFGSTVNALHPIPVQALITLSTNDALSVFIQNNTGTDNILVESLNFTPISIGGTSNVTAQQVVISWKGLTTPTNVTSTGLMDITGGVISTTAEVNVVSLWNGSATPVPVTAGTGITITGGVITATGGAGGDTLEDAYTTGDGTMTMTTGKALEFKSSSAAIVPTYFYRMEADPGTNGLVSLEASIAFNSALNPLNYYSERVYSEDSAAASPSTRIETYGLSNQPNLVGSPRKYMEYIGSTDTLNVSSLLTKGQANAGVQTTLGSVITATENYPVGGGLTPVWTALSGTSIIYPYSFPIGSVIEIDCVGYWNYFQPTTVSVAPSVFNITFGSLMNINSTDTNPSPTTTTDGGPFNFRLQFIRTASNKINISGNGNLLKDGTFVNNYSFPDISTNSYDESLSYTIGVNWFKGIVITDGYYNFICRGLTINQKS